MSKKADLGKKEKKKRGKDYKTTYKETFVEPIGAGEETNE